MNNALIPSNEFEKLKERINFLKSEIARLTQEKHDLEYEECPRLKALFMEKIGDLANLISALELAIAELKYRILLAQRAINRSEALKKEQMDQKVSEEYQEYHKKVDEQFRRAQEAKDQENSKEQKRAEQEERYNKRQEEKKEQSNSSKDISKADSVNENRNEQGKTFQEDGRAEKKADEFEGMTFKQKVKELYRRIVKKLHPDMNPNITDRQKELWLRAQKAYEEFDLEDLESIYDEINQVDSDQVEDTTEGLEKLRQMISRLEKQRDELISEIEEIKNEFPYDQKELLEDEEKIEALQKRMGDTIKQYKKQIEELTAYLEQLMSQLKSEQ